MWSSIKSLLKDNRTKCIIVEDGKPAYVVLPFGEYQHLQKNEGQSIVNPERSAGGREVNGELQEARESYNSPINLEDLPF